MTRRTIPVVLVLASCSLGWSSPPREPSVPPTVAEQYLFAAANAERAQRGLRLLRWDDALYRAADLHAREMAAQGEISHQFPGEPELSERGREAGASFSVIAENVAVAANAVRIHNAWMNSAGHRENLLDTRVDAVGIAVIRRGEQLYAVEDFDRSVTTLSLGEQEIAVSEFLRSKYSIAVLPPSEDAQKTCAMETGYAGDREPMFVMRYTATDITKLPDALKTKLASGRYSEAAVGACTASGTTNFSVYTIAVMLYP